MNLLSLAAAACVALAASRRRIFVSLMALL